LTESVEQTTAMVDDYKYRYRICPQLNLVHVKLLGDIEIPDLIANERRMLSDPTFQPGMDEIVDLSQCWFSGTFLSGFMFKDFISNSKHARGPCRWAVVAPDDSMFTYVHIFSLMAHDDGIFIGVFRDIEQAFEWLGIPEQDFFLCF
jgi:hypothetical protein